MTAKTFDFKGSKEKLDSLKGELSSLDANQVRMFNLSVPSAISYAMTTYKSFYQAKEKFAATFKPESFNPDTYENFPTRVAALWHADVMLQQATDPKGNLAEMLELSKPMHQKISKAALYLWGDDEELSEIITQLRAGSSHMDRADDLARYAAMFKENWVSAEGNSSVTLQDIDDASDMSMKLMDAMTTVSDSEVAEIRDTRNRAGEYVRRAMDDIRDAAAYIYRNDQEALKMYPSLYTSNSAGRKKRTSVSPSLMAKEVIDAEVTTKVNEKQIG